MGSKPPVTLILGHSLVRRMRHTLETGFDQRTNQNFNLEGTAFASIKAGFPGTAAKSKRK